MVQNKQARHRKYTILGQGRNVEWGARQKSQTSWTSRTDTNTSGDGQRCGRSQEKKGGMHGATLGITEKETGMREHSKELGEGRRWYGAGTVLVREANGY